MLFFIWLWVLIVFLIFGINEDIEVKTAAIAALCVFFLGMISLSLSYPSGLWSPPSLFLAVLGIFHLGLTPFWIFDIKPELPLSYDSEWFYGPNGSLALQLVLIGVASFVLGSLFVSAMARKSSSESRSHESESQRALNMQYLGAVLLVIGVVMWGMISIQAGGLSIFFTSYRSFLVATGGTQLGYVYQLIGLGLGLTLIHSLERLLPRIAVLAFLLFAVLAFFIGLRGEVLFPIVVGLSVVAFRRKMPSFVLSTVIFVVVLALINIAKEVRRVGLGSSGFSWNEASPLAALEELGSTIRVVATVVDWHHFSSDEFREGDTYSVAIVRFWESITSPSTVLPATEDYRLMHTEVADRAGNIGGSIIGEAYHNFAVYGVVVVLILFGLLISYLAFNQNSLMSIALYIVIAIPLFNHIRNSFVPVVPFTIFGFVVLFVIAKIGTPKTEPIKEKPSLRQQ